MRRLRKLLALLAGWLLALPAFADSITIPYSFTAGETITAAKFNSNFSAITTVVNGNLDDNNIKVGASIATSKLNLTAEMPVLRSAGNRCLSAGVTGDTVPRVSLTSSGLITFGAGSASAHDMGIKREDANTLAVRDAGDSTYKDFKAGVLTLGTALSAANGGTGLTSPGTSGNVLTSNGSAWVSSASNVSLPMINGGRLTLTTAVPVTTTDVTAATTLYFTPFNGNQIALYDGSSTWNLRSFSELSASLSGLTANTNYDVFIYDNSGSAAIDSLTAWSTNTARATALTLQNGVLVKSGATTRRYVGTIRITGTTGQCEDSTSKRFVYNYCNRIPRMLKAVDTANSWTYASTTLRASNSNTTDGQGRFSLVIGVDEAAIMAHYTQGFTNGGAALGMPGIGIDSTSTTSAITNACNNGASGVWNNTATYIGLPGVGYHYVQALERCSSATTVTFYGTASNTGQQFYSQSGLISRVEM